MIPYVILSCFPWSRVLISHSFTGLNSRRNFAVFCDKWVQLHKNAAPFWHSRVFQISTPSPILILPEPVQRTHLSRVCLTYSPLISHQQHLRSSGCFPHGSDVPCSDLDRIFRIQEGGDNEFGMRPSWYIRLSVSFVIGYRLLPWTLDSWFHVSVSGTCWFLHDRVVGPTQNPQDWRTVVLIFVCLLILDLSGLIGPFPAQLSMSM